MVAVDQELPLPIARIPSCGGNLVGRPLLDRAGDKGGRIPPGRCLQATRARHPPGPSKRSWPPRTRTATGQVIVQLSRRPVLFAFLLVLAHFFPGPRPAREQARGAGVRSSAGQPFASRQAAGRGSAGCVGSWVSSLRACASGRRFCPAIDAEVVVLLPQSDDEVARVRVPSGRRRVLVGPGSRRANRHLQANGAAGARGAGRPPTRDPGRQGQARELSWRVSRRSDRVTHVSPRSRAVGVWPAMKPAERIHHDAEVLREYVPIEKCPVSVAFVGKLVWFARDDELVGSIPGRSRSSEQHRVPSARASTAFDRESTSTSSLEGDPRRPAGRRDHRPPDAVAEPRRRRRGITWADGVSVDRKDIAKSKIHEIDHEELEKIVKTLTSDRFVTGVSCVDGVLWHGASEDRQPCELRPPSAADSTVEEVRSPSRWTRSPASKPRATAASGAAPSRGCSDEFAEQSMLDRGPPRRVSSYQAIHVSVESTGGEDPLSRLPSSPGWRFPGADALNVGGVRPWRSSWH